MTKNNFCRYKLNEYLPIHCWLQECTRLGENRFWDLLRIVGERQKDVMDGKWEKRRGIEVEGNNIVLNTQEQSKEGREERIQNERMEQEAVQKLYRCFFCGQQFVRNKECENHEMSCEEVY